MTLTPRLAVLTPPGTGAVGVVAVNGPGAWQLVAPLVTRPDGRPLPADPAVPAFWVGTLAGDEVVVSRLKPPPDEWAEVHGHGGPRAVRSLVAALTAAGAVEVSADELPGRDEAGTDPRALDLLSRAPTARTAGILLDQYHGAYLRTERELALDPDPARLARLVALASVGRHLVEPWRVVLAGPPNVGKSSLANALAGYARSVVTPVAGTTRDVVTTRLAFNGWPVELTDTAGLRHGADALEAAGIDRARGAIAAADLVIWVTDGSDPTPVFPTAADGLPADRVMVVANKADLPAAWDAAGVRRVSAATGAGVADLADAVARRLVPAEPEPGEAVPLTPVLAAVVDIIYTGD